MDTRLHLAVDAVGIKYGGGATVLLDFIEAALAEPRIEQLSVFTSLRELRRFTLPADPRLTEIEVPNVDSSTIARFRWHLVDMGKRSVKIGADLVLCFANMGRTPTPYVVFIQQSLPFSREALATLRLPQRARMTIIREMMRYSCRSARHVLVQTPVMVSALQAAFGLNGERISYFLPSTKLPDQLLEPEHALLELFQSTPEGQRLLFVGGYDDTYRMLGTVIEGMKLLREILPQAVLYLTLPKDHPFSSIPGIVCCGILDRAELRYAYQMTTLLVLPSLVETVGLPMIEAMSVGTPTAAADRPYAHTVCEDAAVYFDPYSPEDFAAVVKSVLCDPEQYAALKAAAQALNARRNAQDPYAQMVSRLIELAHNPN